MTKPCLGEVLISFLLAVTLRAGKAGTTGDKKRSCQPTGHVAPAPHFDQVPGVPMSSFGEK